MTNFALTAAFIEDMNAYWYAVTEVVDELRIDYPGASEAAIEIMGADYGIVYY